MRNFRKKTRNKTFLLKTEQLKQAVKNNRVRISFLLISGLALFSLAASVHSFALTSAYFNVTEIEVTDKYPEQVSHSLAGIRDNPNIFALDLKKISRNLEEDHADIQKAVVRRMLPNKLSIEILRRSPLAQVAIAKDKTNSEGYSFFSINEDGYILAELGTAAADKLPVIYGSGFVLDHVQPGCRYQGANLSCAISFLKEMKNYGFLQRYCVTKLDASDVKSLSFYLNDKIEVKIGNRDWKKKMETLIGIMQKVKMDENEEYYIDIRFKNLFFGKKNVKK